MGGWVARKLISRECEGADRSNSSLFACQAQGAFGKPYIPVAIELAAYFAEDGDGLETEALVQRDGGRIWERVSGDDAVDVFAGERFEERCVEAGADTSSEGVVTAVDCRFDAGEVGGFVAKARGACVPHHSGVFLGDQEAVSSSGCELVKPCDARFDGVRREIECDRGVDDVVVVDFGEARKVVAMGWSDADTVHGGW
jgi:hypothetical protein